jgi:hypothetical protein
MCTVPVQDPDSAVRCINIDPERRQLVAGTEFGKLLLWDMDRLDGGWGGAVIGMCLDIHNQT